MDSILTKAGSFFLAKRAKQEMSSFGDDIDSMSSSVEGGARHFFNKLKGKMQKPLPDLLQMYGLPKGLFPRNTTHYEFEESTGKLTVFLPFICEVGFKDSSVVRYAANLTGILKQGMLTDIEGMKTKVLIWVKVTSVSIEDPTKKKICFSAGMKKSRPMEAYEVLRDGIEADQF